MSILSKPYFHDELAAFERLEEVLWKGEPVCPHCGSINNATKLQGQATRIGVWKCKDRHCRKQFTVKVGTVFEHGRIPLHKMLQAVHLMASSKKGISAHQLHRILEIQYKSAWRSEEHTSELQSLMRISYAVFCLKKKKTKTKPIIYTNTI